MFVYEELMGSGTVLLELPLDVERPTGTQRITELQTDSSLPHCVVIIGERVYLQLVIRVVIGMKLKMTKGNHIWNIDSSINITC